MPEGYDGETLRYPLYLDVPMMVSFLATLQEGISFEEKVQIKTATKRQVTGSTDGGVKAPSIPGLSSLLSFDLRGKLSVNRDSEGAEELEMIRQHTEASLFNRLRNVLHDPSVDAIVRLSDESQWGSLRIGELVEITGEVVRNPLSEVLSLFSRLMEPVLQPQHEETKKQIAREQEELTKLATARKQQKPANNAPQSRKASQGMGLSQNQQVTDVLEQLLSPELSETAQKDALAKRIAELNQQEQFMQIVRIIRDDVNQAHMQDVLLQPTELPGYSCILTLTESNGFDKRPLNDLLGAELVILGKVTRVLKEGESINLLRRSSLGFLSESISEELMGTLQQVPGLNLRLDRLQVRAPAVQILPLAIFA